MSRSEQLRQGIQDFLATHRDWQRDNRSEHPDETYTEHVQALDAVFSAGDVPDDCRELLPSVQAFLDAYAAYWETSASKPQPPDQLWVALERMANAAKPPLMATDKIKETIAELNEQKVGHAQIAKEWNLLTPRGEPNVAYVLMELRNPGCIVDAGKYPDGREWISREEAKRRARAGQAAEASAKLAAAPKPQATGKVRQPCPETAEELFLQGVSIPQAATMLCLSVGDVTELWQQFQTEANAAKDEPPANRSRKKAATAE